jgi:hypothetical protein
MYYVNIKGDIYMKAFKGSFKKKSGENREMFFARISDLPSQFVAAKIVGAGNEQKYPKGMELVWDLEQDDFRIFNWNNTSSPITETEIDENLLN